MYLHGGTGSPRLAPARPESPRGRAWPRFLHTKKHGDSAQRERWPRDVAKCQHTERFVFPENVDTPKEEGLASRRSCPHVSCSLVGHRGKRLTVERGGRSSRGPLRVPGNCCTSLRPLEPADVPSPDDRGPRFGTSSLFRIVRIRHSGSRTRDAREALILGLPLIEEMRMRLCSGCEASFAQSCRIWLRRRRERTYERV